MRLPVNPFLYIVSAGLLGLAGYTFYLVVKEGDGKVRTRGHERGVEVSDGLLSKGKGQGPTSSTWNYDKNTWGARFNGPNLTGKVPVVEQPKVEEGPKEVPRDQRPLNEIIELVSLMHDGARKGEGGRSHIIVRYRDGTDVQPPRWYLLENQNLASAPAAGPADSVAANRGGARPNNPRPATQRPNTPATPVPTSSAGMEIVQRVWVESDGSPRSQTKLWPPFDDVKLVRVSADARSAFFVRTPPPPKEGEEPVKPAEEQLFKTSMPIPQDVIAAIVELQRREGAAFTATTPSLAPVRSSAWQDVAETTRIGDTVHVSRKDQQVFNENPESMLERINVDTYHSKQGTNLRGLRVLNIAPELSTRYGVQQNDLLLSLNGTPVSTKADAIALGKRLYNRGVRTFVAKFLSDGREVERTYQVPDR